MEEKKRILLELLDKNIEKYPNIAGMWKTYILNLYKNLDDNIEHCNKLFNNIENITNEDLDKQTILSLYILNQNTIYDEN